jgi:hypothetical protein
MEFASRTGDAAKPNRRSAQKKTRQANEHVGLHLKQAFGQRSLPDLSAGDIEHYLRRRLQARVR